MCFRTRRWAVEINQYSSRKIWEMILWHRTHQLRRPFPAKGVACGLAASCFDFRTTGRGSHPWSVSYELVTAKLETSKDPWLFRLHCNPSTYCVTFWQVRDTKQQLKLLIIIMSSLFDSRDSQRIVSIKDRDGAWHHSHVVLFVPLHACSFPIT
jgi:hypothetical protein